PGGRSKPVRPRRSSSGSRDRGAWTSAPRARRRPRSPSLVRPSRSGSSCGRPAAGDLDAASRRGYYRPGGSDQPGAREERVLGIDVKSEALAELIDPSAEVERVATGFTFTEGPIWNKAGEFLLFSDMPGDVRRRWSGRDGVEELMRPSNKCNGMVYDAEGNLLVCEHVTSSLVRERPDGTRETIATHYRGKELNS